MMICTKCQEIYDNNYNNRQFNGMCPKKHCCGDVVWIDENMVLPCKMLWDKGYETMFTCEGHYKEWGGAPYIIFKVPINVALPEMYTTTPFFDSDISDGIVVYYKNMDVSSKCYNIDYSNAIIGKFETTDHEEWWKKYGDIAIGFWYSPFYQNIVNNYSFDDLEIRILEYGFIKISIYFKSITRLLMDKHPDEDCEASDLVHLHAEDDLFMMHLQHKFIWVMDLINYIKKLPNINSKHKKE